MNKEKAETLLENYQALSELYSNIRKELDRTRKALEIAVDALKEIIDWDKCVALQSNDFVGIANKALEQITTQEQQNDN